MPGSWSLGLGPGFRETGFPQYEEGIVVPGLGAGHLLVGIAPTSDGARRAAAYRRIAATPWRPGLWDRGAEGCPGDSCWSHDAGLMLVKGGLALQVGFHDLQGGDSATAAQEDAILAVVQRVVDEWDLLVAQGEAPDVAPAPPEATPSALAPFVLGAGDLAGYELAGALEEPWLDLGGSSATETGALEYCQYFVAPDAEVRYTYLAYALLSSSEAAAEVLEAYAHRHRLLDLRLQGGHTEQLARLLSGRSVALDSMARRIAEATCPGDECGFVSVEAHAVMVARRGPLLLAVTSFSSTTAAPERHLVEAQDILATFGLAQEIVARYDAWAPAGSTAPAPAPEPTGGAQ